MRIPPVLFLSCYWPAHVHVGFCQRVPESNPRHKFPGISFVMSSLPACSRGHTCTLESRSDLVLDRKRKSGPPEFLSVNGRQTENLIRVPLTWLLGEAIGIQTKTLWSWGSLRNLGFPSLGCRVLGGGSFLAGVPESWFRGAEGAARKNRGLTLKVQGNDSWRVLVLVLVLGGGAFWGGRKWPKVLGEGSFLRNANQDQRVLVLISMASLRKNRSCGGDRDRHLIALHQLRHDDLAYTDTQKAGQKTTNSSGNDTLSLARRFESVRRAVGAGDRTQFPRIKLNLNANYYYQQSKVWNCEGAFCCQVPITLLLESLYSNKVDLAKDRSLNGITIILRSGFLC